MIYLLTLVIFIALQVFQPEAMFTKMSQNESNYESLDNGHGSAWRSAYTYSLHWQFMSEPHPHGPKKPKKQFHSRWAPDPVWKNAHEGTPLLTILSHSLTELRIRSILLLLRDGQSCFVTTSQIVKCARKSIIYWWCTWQNQYVKTTNQLSTANSRICYLSNKFEGK